MERQVRASPTTHHHCALWLVPRFSAVCVVCCVVAWWAWLVVVLVATPRLFRCHQCLCFQSFTTHPPRFTTQSQSLSSSCPCAHSFCHSLTHTHSQATPPRHTHTHVVAGALWCLVCVCVPTVLAVAAPGSPLTRPPTPCAPHHTTPPLAAGGCGGGSVGVVACVATWSTHWLCWCCPLPIHTHTRGDGHVVVVAVCVVWLPPPLCAFPTNHHHCVRCPALSAVCEWWHHAHPPTVVPPTLVCACVSVSGVATTPTTHAVVPCALSLLSLAMPHLPHSHKCHASLHSHTWRALCGSSHPLTHTHTGCLTAHTPSTHHHHWVCVCSSTCSHPPHTHTGRTGVAHAWVVAGVVTTTTPLVPHHHTHTHSGTGGVGHGGAWWCACALCVPPTPPSHSPSLPPPPPTLLCHHRPHTHTRDLVHAPLPHTHATCTTTHTKACCVLTTPCHTHHHPLHPPIHTHTTWHTHGISHTATMVLAIAHHAVHSHTTDATHTHHTGDRPRPSTPLAVAFREPPPPRWSCPFALLSSSLLVHQPLFSLSQACTHTPLMCSSPPPCHPSRVCGVCCGDGQHQAPQWW